MPAITHWADVLRALAAAAHPRLGSAAAASIQRVAASRDLLLAIMRHIPLVVPDDCPTLIAALRIAVPWQRIVLRRGEHLAGSSSLDGPGGSQARLRVPIELCGEEGAVLRGTLVLEAGCAGGVIRDCCLEDTGDCCLRCEGGSWELSRLRLRCAHGAALLACGAADVTLDDCVLGGESQEEVSAGTQVQLSAYGSVQEAKLPKRACYAVVARDEARVVARRCELRQVPALTTHPHHSPLNLHPCRCRCHRRYRRRRRLPTRPPPSSCSRLPTGTHTRQVSEAAVLVAHNGRVQLEASLICDAPAALIAGQRRGRALELRGSVVAASVKRLWADSDRPRAFVWGEGSRREGRDVDGVFGEGEAEGAESFADIVPRGAEEGSGASTESLDEQEFADMERLMEELDAQALGSTTGPQ